MKLQDVLEILDYKIVLEEESEYPNTEVIKALHEVGYLIAMTDEYNEDIYMDEPYCTFCGESLKECCCDCDYCDSCDECTCCDSEEDYALTDEEYEQLYADLIAKVLDR